MVERKRNPHFVESTGELPDLSKLEHVTIDFETTSGSPKLMGVNPHTSKVLGIAAGNHEIQYYIPLRHKDQTNLDRDRVGEWFRDYVYRYGWDNQNPKFDARFASIAEGWIEIDKLAHIRDLRVRSHLLDENRGRYTLDSICEQLLELHIAKRSLIENTLKDAKSKDYGDIPFKMLARYAMIDVELTSACFFEAEKRLPKELTWLLDMEDRLTKTLTKMEVRGIRINYRECLCRAKKHGDRIREIFEELTDRVGVEFNPGSHKDLNDVMQNHLDVPVFGRSDKTGAPSWGWEPLSHAIAWARKEKKDEFLTQTLLLIREWVRHQKAFTMFYIPWIDKSVNGRLYPTYNQIGTHTGRLSSSGPNIQQVPATDRDIWIPDEGYVFVFGDYSQVEYRVFAHYAGGAAAEAYTAGADADFHEHVRIQISEMVGFEVPRWFAKGLNFGMIYGMGKEKCVRHLSSQRQDAEAREVTYQTASKFYDAYLKKFPNIKPMLRVCSNRCRTRGYVFNIFGRRRHLPSNETFKAFNSICQGSAADICKTAMVLLDEAGYDLVLNMHDELVVQCEREGAEDAKVSIKKIMESAACSRLDPIPLHVEMEISDRWHK